MNKLIIRIISLLFSFILGIYIAMYYCYKQPIDEHVNISNRYINWPESNCYSQSDVELIVFGKILPNDE